MYGALARASRLTSFQRSVGRASLNRKTTNGLIEMTIERPPQSHVRLLRRRAGLTQRELAFILGYRSESQISRLENGSRVPRASELLMIEMVFGVASAAVFPSLGARASAFISMRIAELRALDPSQSKEPVRTSFKTAHLDRIVESIRRHLPFGLSVHQPWSTTRPMSEIEPQER